MTVVPTGQEQFPELAPAFSALEALVREHVRADDGRQPEVSIYVFGEPPNGVRISEIGCWWPSANGPGGSGTAYMRSEAYSGGSVLLCAEDFLLCYGADPVWDDRHPDEPPSVDDENEARWRLVMALTDDAKKADASWAARERPS